MASTHPLASPATGLEADEPTGESGRHELTAWQAIPFPELEGAALIRELHVYGQLVPTAQIKKSQHSQHVGFGRMLMQAAERKGMSHPSPPAAFHPPPLSKASVVVSLVRIAALHGFRTVAVIAGIGTRNYYRKLGYRVEGDGGFMIKRLPWHHTMCLLRTAIQLVASLALIVLLTTISGVLAGGWMERVGGAGGWSSGGEIAPVVPPPLWRAVPRGVGRWIGKRLRNPLLPPRALQPHVSPPAMLEAAIPIAWVSSAAGLAVIIALAGAAIAIALPRLRPDLAIAAGLIPPPVATAAAAPSAPNLSRRQRAKELHKAKMKAGEEAKAKGKAKAEAHMAEARMAAAHAEEDEAPPPEEAEPAVAAELLFP